MSFEDVQAVADLDPKARTVTVTQQPRKIVGLDIRDGVIMQGYIMIHTVDANGQEIAQPRETPMTEKQLAAFNAAMAGILGAK